MISSRCLFLVSQFDIDNFTETSDRFVSGVIFSQDGVTLHIVITGLGEHSGRPERRVSDLTPGEARQPLSVTETRRRDISRVSRRRRT